MKLGRILLLLVLLYGVIKIASCCYYGVIVYRTAGLTPWRLFDGCQAEVWKDTADVCLVTFIYRLDGYAPSYMSGSIKEIEIAEAERQMLHHVVRSLLANSACRKREYVPLTPGLQIEFQGELEDGIRLWFELREKGFRLRYTDPRNIFPYPCTLISGSHTEETQRLWGRYGKIEYYLPLSEETRKHLRQEREYHPTRLNALDESSLEDPLWKPTLGLVEDED